MRFNEFLNLNNDFIVLRVWVKFEDCLPIVFEEFVEGSEEVWFQFRRMTHRDFLRLENECITEVIGVNERDKIYVYDALKLKTYILRHMVVGWCFDKPLSFDQHGLLTDESYLDLLKVHPRILRAIVGLYDYRLDLSDEEAGQLERDCYVIFGKGSSVSNTNPYLSLYLELSSFWDKFGLNYYDLLNLPHEMYEGLRKVMSEENKNLQTKTASNKSSKNARGGSSQTYGF